MCGKGFEEGIGIRLVKAFVRQLLSLVSSGPFPTPGRHYSARGFILPAKGRLLFSIAPARVVSVHFERPSFSAEIIYRTSSGHLNKERTGIYGCPVSMSPFAWHGDVLLATEQEEDTVKYLLVK